VEKESMHVISKTMPFLDKGNIGIWGEPIHIRGIGSNPNDHIPEHAQFRIMV
jgi:hypothetical protein